MALSEESAEELRAAAQEVHQLVLGLADAVRLRPNVETLLLGRELAAGIEVLLNAYLDALTAATPLLAQKAGDVAQKALDDLSAALARSNARTAVLETLQRGNYLDEGGLNLLDAVRQLAPGKTLLQLDQEGSQELSLLTGKEKITPGLGVTHLVLQLMADHHLDPEAYRSKLALAGRMVQQRRDEIADLLTDADFHADMATARSTALRMNVTLDRVLTGGLPESMLVAQLMNAFRECLEFVGLPLIAFALRITGRKTASYRRLRSTDVSALAKFCEDNEDASALAGGYSKAIRHAASHAAAYELKDGAIHINLRTHREVLEFPLFIDRMFEFLESCLALMLVAESELPPSAQQASGTSIFMDGMTPEQQTSFILRSSGASDVERVEQVGDTWTATINRDGPGLVLLCRAIAQWAPSGVRYVRVATDGGERYVEVPLADLQKSRATDIDTPSDVLVLLENATGPTGPLLTTDLLRKLAFNTVAKADASIAGVRDVKAYWKAAQRRGDAELSDALRAALVRLRLGDDAIRNTPEGRHFRFFADIPHQADIPIP